MRQGHCIAAQHILLSTGIYVSTHRAHLVSSTNGNVRMFF